MVLGGESKEAGQGLGVGMEQVEGAMGRMEGWVFVFISRRGRG